MEIAAIVVTVHLAVLWVFQISLAAGAPWGAAAWGGHSKGVLPTSLRVGSGIAAAFLYPLITLYVLVSAEVVAIDWLPGAGKIAMWGLIGFFTLIGPWWAYLVLWVWPLTGPASVFIAIRAFAEHASEDDDAPVDERLYDFSPNPLEAFFLSPCHSGYAVCDVASEL